MALMRLFFAIPVPASAQIAVAALAPRLTAQRGWFWLSARDWHVTLSFLGDTEGALLPALCDLGERVAATTRQTALFFNSVQWWPSENRPRLLAAVAEANESLTAARKLLNAGLREIGVSYDSKPLRPHITLMRLERGVLLEDLSVPACAIEMPVENLALYRSERERGVTHYRPLWQCELPQ